VTFGVRKLLRRRSLFAVTEQVVARMRDGLAVHDGHGRLVAWNPAAESITGWNAAQAASTFTATIPEGLVDLGDGRWVEVRRTVASSSGKPVTVTLFSDARQQVALREAYADLEHVATTDPLTGLPNRLLAEDRLRMSLAIARRDNRPVALLYVDLDRFKVVNDTFGHGAGDDVLREVATRLRVTVRESDTAARVGGDEFIVILHRIGHADDAQRVGEAVLAAVARPFQVGEQEVRLGASVGVALFPEHGDDATGLMQAADLAMYTAKAAGGRAFRSYVPALSAERRDRMLLAAELRNALANDQLELHYQPQIDIDTGRVIGLEALVRWRHPERGLVPPGRFLPVAEDHGVIVDIDRWVATTACEQMRAWDTAGVAVPMVSINLSARSFANEDVAALVTGALDATGVHPSRLEVEVTEQVVASQDGIEEKIRDLKGLGVDIAIDDFGTGYSALANIKRFPVDTIKLDRAFVVDVTGQPKQTDIAVLRSIVTMAGDLGLRCIAEGVETVAQRRVLRFLRCHLVQGFLYGAAMPADELETLLTGPVRARPDLVGSVNAG
jgi:diguanylate cyclase